jgi:hypothetical protein
VLDVIAKRLQAHHLVGTPFHSAEEAIAWFGAVQSQDYPAAKWGLGQRLHGMQDKDVDRVFDKGGILRTHVLRPTWHFVAPRDILWIQELTSARVVAGLAGRHRRLELDQRTIARATDLFGEALSGGRNLTRSELGEVLTAAGISPEGQRLPHLLAVAEHANVITSGPRRGKQFTYALLAERAPRARRLDREEALRELAVRYFTSHGPAQVKDFAWWSGLTVQDIKKGVQLAAGALDRHHVDGLEYWSGGNGARGRAGMVAHLLPNFDEFTVAYRDRSALLDTSIPFDGRAFAYYRDATPMGGILSNIVLIGGRVKGAWSRSLQGGKLHVQVRQLAPLTRTEIAAVNRAAASLGTFLGADRTDLRLD